MLNAVAPYAQFVIAERKEDPSYTTVLTYGHGDVSWGNEGQWRDDLEPWQVVVDGDRWYGRGTADSKGQHSVHIAALADVLQKRKGDGLRAADEFPKQVARSTFTSSLIMASTMMKPITAALTHGISTS